MNLRCVSRSHLLAFFALALVVCPITLTNSANAATDKPKSTATRTARPAQEQPAISQDKEKYLPGEQIILTGNHWAPGESVNIFVSADESEGGAAVHATADETGAFSVTTTMPDVHVGDADAPKSVVTAEASGTRSGGRAHAQFGVGRTGTDGERMIDEETYWNHRLTYPTGKYNPEWLRRAARQDAQVKRGVPAGRRRGQPSSRAFSADGGSATGSGTTSLAPSSGGNITDINSVVAGTAFLPVGPQPERMTGCASCYDYGTTEGRINDIVIDPGTTTNGSIVAYAGSVGGGVWKTTNCCTASTSWTVTTDDPLLATTSINNVTIDPNDHNTIYAGTGDLNYGSFSMGSQGVLKSTNGGNSWTTVGASVFGPEYTEPAGNFPQYNAVGKVRVDPNNSNTILAGTKVGLYISYDGGADWTGPCYTNSFSGQRQDITGLELTNMGNNVTRIFAAVGVRGYATTVQYDLGNNGANGLYLGTVPASGCPSFTAASSNANGFIFGAKVNNASPYATGALLNADSGTIYGGLNVGNQLGRIDIAVAPSNPNVLYAQVQSIAANNNNGCTNTNGCQLGMWASTDGGANWSFMTNSQGGSLFACTGNAGGADYPQNWYDQGIAVDPNNADRVLVNTFETFLVTRAGTAWYDLTCGYNGTSVNNHIVHVDHHAQAFVPGSSDIFLVGDDGGIHGTNNASVANCVPMTTNNITNCTSDSVRPTWFNMDTGINSIEFYSGDISGNFATSAFPALAAGAQDNGPSTVTFNGYPTGPVMWQMGTSGDGFSGLIDPIGTGGTAANGAPQLRFFLGSNSGTFKRCVSNCTDPNAAWPTVGGSFTADQQSFVLPVHLFHGGIPGGDDCPPAGPSGGCGHLLAGTTRVWETITGSAPQPARGNPLVWYVTNNPTTANLTKGTLGNRSFINQVKYSPKYQSVAIVGTNDANVQIGFNLGTGVQAQATWVNVTGGNSVLPNRPVMGIALAPNSTDRTLPIGYAVEGGFSDNTPGYPGHVFRVVCTANCSSFTWTDKSGNLPDIPFDSVIVNPNFPSQIFAGSDFGLYYTDDVTANPPVWKRFNNGLPNVMVWDMAVDRGSTTLALFTRSRGVYVWPLPLGPENPLPTTLTVNPASGPYGGTATLTASLTSGGNPVAGKTIAFSLNGANLGTGTTDSIGNASIIANLGTIPPGTYPGAITASFAGDSTDAASTGSGTLTVTPGSGTVVLVPSATLVKNADGSYTALVTIKNNGTGYAMNVVLTTATLGAATGAPLPQTLGNIAPGGSVITTVTYPSSAGASHAAVIEKYAGTYTGSGFTASLRATLP